MLVPFIFQNTLQHFIVTFQRIRVNVIWKSVFLQTEIVCNYSLYNVNNIVTYF